MGGLILPKPHWKIECCKLRPTCLERLSIFNVLASQDNCWPSASGVLRIVHFTTSTMLDKDLKQLVVHPRMQTNHICLSIARENRLCCNSPACYWSAHVQESSLLRLSTKQLMHSVVEVRRNYCGWHCWCDLISTYFHHWWHQGPGRSLTDECQPPTKLDGCQWQCGELIFMAKTDHLSLCRVQLQAVMV